MALQAPMVGPGPIRFDRVNRAEIERPEASRRLDADSCSTKSMSRKLRYSFSTFNGDSGELVIRNSEPTNPHNSRCTFRALSWQPEPTNRTSAIDSMHDRDDYRRLASSRFVKQVDENRG